MSVFISHATEDKPIATDLRERLTLHGIHAWVDSRELTAGNKLDAKIEEAIAGSDAVFVVLSPKTINSRWVTKEIDCANQLGKPVIPLLLPGIEPAGLDHWFADEPLAAKVDIDRGGLDNAMPSILAALHQRLPVDPTKPAHAPAAGIKQPELLLELTEPTIVEADGKRRATATARLIYRPVDPTVRDVESRRFRFTAPLGPIEAGELEWYLETYWRWPTGVYKDRAAKVEADLPKWGKLLLDEISSDITREALTAFDRSKDEAAGARRFTVNVDRDPITGSTDDQIKTAGEAATLLLSLPWELLHDSEAYLFDGPHGVRARRQLPNRKPGAPLPSTAPIRILLISPRPDTVAMPDGKSSPVGYINHRVTAEPLVEALEPLGDLTKLTVLTPGTFEALEEALRTAHEAGTPYHVVHFDGHGVYNPRVGLGALLFEDADDSKKSHGRRGKAVDAAEIGAMMRQYRVPLVFLDACQTAMAVESPTASVAGKLLEGGVASVVAMSHSVLVETARRFVTAFYDFVLDGDRVGTAMLAGQRALHKNAWRMKTFAGDLHLRDWFVPVLYQEEHDPSLIKQVPSAEVQAVKSKERASRLGALPEPPPQTFVGRSRELLMAERILEQHPYVLLRGEGGEGKTTLASELARWLVRSGRFDRAAFVAFDQISDTDTALSLIGQQLVGPEYLSIAGQGEGRGRQAVDRALADHRTIIVFDNMESVLEPPAGSPAALTFDPEVLEGILNLCSELIKAPGGSNARSWDGRPARPSTHLIFTSREPLPTPFDSHRIDLGRLTRTDAIALVAKTLGEDNLMPGTANADASDAEIEALVDAAACHARALVLLTREVVRRGVKNATKDLADLMRSMHDQYPDDRERSLFASVELSLRRLPEGVRERIGR